MTGGKRQRVGIESVGGDYPRSGIKILTMNFGNQIGAREAKQLEAPMKGNIVAGEQLAPKIRFVKSERHNHCGHGSVEHKNLRGKCIGKG